MERREKRSSEDVISLQNGSFHSNFEIGIGWIGVRLLITIEKTRFRFISTARDTAQIRSSRTIDLRDLPERQEQLSSLFLFFSFAPNLANGDSTETMIESEVLHSVSHLHRELITLIEFHFVLVHFESSNTKINEHSRSVLPADKCKDEFLRSEEEFPIGVGKRDDTFHFQIDSECVTTLSIERREKSRRRRWFGIHLTRTHLLTRTRSTEEK